MAGSTKETFRADFTKARVRYGSLMAIAMRAISPTTVLKARANTSPLTETNMKARWSITNAKDKVKRSTPMEMSMKVNSKTAREVAKER